jgi:hypothetical protein
MKKDKKENQGIEIIAQLQGMRNNPVEGGWRITLDLFETRPQDIMILTSLVSDKETVKLKILPVTKEDIEKAGE